MICKNIYWKKMEENWPSECPHCKGKKITGESKSEYTGGGYADYWTEYFCEECEYLWKSTKSTNYF
jgi:hypothetical protein